MDLILWRHAEAADGGPDLERQLTERGREQAAHMAAWVRARLPADLAVVSSPAARARQTAEALGLPVRLEPSLAPGATVSAIMAAARWPGRAGAAVLVGHQPDLGQAAYWLVCRAPGAWSLEKGALWWLQRKGSEAHVRAVVSPDLL